MKTLICLPSSGSAASLFSNWEPLLKEKDIRLIRPEYPARGRRFNDPPVTHINELVLDLINQLQETLQSSTEYCLFGHSLGGLVAYELTIELTKQALPLPKKVIISSRHAPNQKSLSPLSSSMGDTNLINLLKEMGGLSPELLEHKELLELVLQTIRADLKLNENYRRFKQEKLNCPIITIHGNIDPVAHEPSITAWKTYTTASHDHLNIEGDHFYFQKNLPYFISTITRYL